MLTLLPCCTSVPDFLFLCLGTEREDLPVRAFDFRPRPFFGEDLDNTAVSTGVSTISDRGKQYCHQYMDTGLRFCGYCTSIFC